MDSSDDDFIDNLLESDFLDSTNLMETICNILPASSNNFDWHFGDEVNQGRGPGQRDQYFHVRDILGRCQNDNPAKFRRLFR